MTHGTAIVVFTRDLRVHDNPTLQAACGSAERIVPLFVLDRAILGSSSLAPNRATFLVDALRDLDESLCRRGSGLVIRCGDPAEETAALASEVGAHSVHVSADWSRHARSRQRRLGERLSAAGVVLYVHDHTVAVVPPGVVFPKGRDHFAVFTPYHRRWSDLPVRPVLDPPGRLLSPRVRRGRIPDAEALRSGPRAGRLPQGGENAARRRMQVWLRSSVASYADRRDVLACDDTSRLSPYLHLGCLSPVELISRAGRSAGARAFVRQLAWRDFNLQLLAARPEVASQDYRHHRDRWRHDEDAFAAWRAGRTGYPVVDAAMRQLRQEGWMHNRARLIAASFLTKSLHLDWREGARHFLHLLVDGDVANNQLNWQWVAGTGTDTRSNRVLNPLRQAERYDPDGAYVRRYVTELAHIDGPAVHAPWNLPEEIRRRLDYPERIIDLDQSRRRFLESRRAGGARK
jgi:deoxyribodipyrimidine photo-lyase